MITISDYSKDWPQMFSKLKSEIWPHIRQYATSMEHVGSTSVYGLSAKPVIDIDIVIESRKLLKNVISTLEKLGYSHRGDLGIKDREAFSCRNPEFPHNLYVCIEGSTALRNHLILRDHLSKNKRDRDTYANLKKKLAEKYTDDIDSYIEGKTEFIVSILNQYIDDKEELQNVIEVNKAKR